MCLKDNRLRTLNKNHTKGKTIEGRKVSKEKKSITSFFQKKEDPNITNRSLIGKGNRMN